MTLLKRIGLLLLIPMSVMFTSTAHAESTETIQQMAKVLLHLNNKATKQQRQTLEKISTDKKATQNEQNLAKAILNLKGSIRDKDKPLVWGVLRNISAGEGEREIAKIVNGFETKASKIEQARLTKLLPPPKKEAKK